MHRRSRRAGLTGAVRAVVTGTFGAKLRREPRLETEVLRLLPAHTTDRLLNQDDRRADSAWRQVMVDGTLGWAAAAFLKSLPQAHP